VRRGDFYIEFLSCKLLLDKLSRSNKNTLFTNLFDKHHIQIYASNIAIIKGKILFIFMDFAIQNGGYPA